MTLRWTKKLSCGIKAIDKDHKRLFELVEMFNTSLKDDTNPKHFTSLIKGLDAYAKEHFTREEMYMKTAGYPNFKKHRKAHREFRNNVALLKHLSKRKPNKIDRAKVLTFLETWLVNHIQKDDMAFVPYLNGTVEGDQNVKTSDVTFAVSIGNDKYEIPVEKKKQLEKFLALLAGEGFDAKILSVIVDEVSNLHKTKDTKKAMKYFGIK